MAETKIKVNELPQEAPTLNDTLLGSNVTKEYACKIEDLASLMSDSASNSSDVVSTTIIAPEQGVVLSSYQTPVKLTLADGVEIDETSWLLGLYDIVVTCTEGGWREYFNASMKLNFIDYQDERVVGNPICTSGYYAADSASGDYISGYPRFDAYIYDFNSGTLLDGVYVRATIPGLYTVSISLHEIVTDDFPILKPLLFETEYNNTPVRTFTVCCNGGYAVGIRVDASVLKKVASQPVTCIYRPTLRYANGSGSQSDRHRLSGLLFPLGWTPLDSGYSSYWYGQHVRISPTQETIFGLMCAEAAWGDEIGDHYTYNELRTVLLIPDDVELTVHE